MATVCRGGCNPKHRTPRFKHLRYQGHHENRPKRMSRPLMDTDKEVEVRQHPTYGPGHEEWDLSPSDGETARRGPRNEPPQHESTERVA